MGSDAANTPPHFAFNGEQPHSTEAPKYSTPDRVIVGIEHPFIIEDVENGIASLGDSHRLTTLIDNATECTSRLRLRPGDRLSSPLSSTNLPTDDILLKITVPRRIRSRRKRGVSDESYQAPLDSKTRSGRSHETESSRLFRSLRENPTAYKIEAAGVIKRTHRFRGMPDFVLSTTNAPFLNHVRETILPFDYEKLKDFKFNMKRGLEQNTEIIPPPSWSQVDLPFNYGYHQNPSTRHVLNEQGELDTINIHAPTKQLNQPVSCDVESVPQGPDPRLTPLEKLEPSMQNLIAEAKKLLSTRPIYTRKALQNSLPPGLWKRIGPNSAKYVYQYISYTFSSGPWRDAVVSFGVDPRSDPKYRIYQTMTFLSDDPQSEKPNKGTSQGSKDAAPTFPKEKSHLFDGTAVSRQTKIWQVCDITDPLVSRLLNTDNLRPTCHVEGDGWYWNGTWATAKVLTKATMADISAGKTPQRATYESVARIAPRILKLGESINKPKGGVSAEENRLLNMIRSNALTQVVKPKVGRPRKKKEGVVGEDDMDIDGETSIAGPALQEPGGPDVA